jgi:hypothetical protein
MSPTRRRGQIVIVAIALALAASILVTVSTRHRARTSNWVRHVEQELGGDDLLDSALEEAFHWVQMAANDPGSPAFHILRAADLPPLVLLEELAWSQGRLAEVGGSPGLEVELRVEDRELPTGDATEWHGLLVLEARWGSRSRSRVHEIRAARLTLPSPLDEACFHDWRSPGAGFPAGELWVDPQEWDELATLRVEAAGGASIQESFEDLVEHLDALSGVVFVANAPGDRLRLRGYEHRGRTLLVTEGPLELVDVTLADPARDQLTVLTLGDVTLGGEVEAVVALSGTPSTPDAVRQLLPGLDVEGALILAAGTYTAARDTHLRCAPTPGANATGPVLEQVHVAISPHPVVEGRS